MEKTIVTLYVIVYLYKLNMEKTIVTLYVIVYFYKLNMEKTIVTLYVIGENVLHYIIHSLKGY
jgi:hypothetical protein